MGLARRTAVPARKVASRLALIALIGVVVLVIAVDPAAATGVRVRARADGAVVANKKAKCHLESNESKKKRKQEGTKDKETKREAVAEAKCAAANSSSDLKVAYAGATAVKCGGPAGAWTLKFIAYGSGTGHAVATFTLAKGTLTGAYAFSGTADIGASFSESGSVTYTASADGKSGMLAFSLRGTYPVTVGKFCKNGAPLGG